jgi:hypothetical protein
MPNTWFCNHFSLANAHDDGPSDLPHLLRRLAAEIEQRKIEPLEILDLTVSKEITGNGPRWSGTVYWSPDQAKGSEQQGDDATDS